MTCTGCTSRTTGKKRRKPLRAEWLVHELTDAGKEVQKRMLPTKKRCPRCGRVLPAEAFNLVRGGRELAGWCRACNHRYYLDRKGSGIRQEEPERAEDCAWRVYRCGRQVYRPRIGKGRASERVPLFVQDMQDVWSVRFTCLLVCQSAIFIDSKRDGNRAAPWQKGLQDEERQGA